MACESHAPTQTPQPTHRSGLTCDCTSNFRPSSRATMVMAANGQSLAQSVQPKQRDKSTSAFHWAGVRRAIHHGTVNEINPAKKNTAHNAPPPRRSVNATGHKYHQSIAKPCDLTVICAAAPLKAGSKAETA